MINALIEVSTGCVRVEGEGQRGLFEGDDP